MVLGSTGAKSDSCDPFAYRTLAKKVLKANPGQGLKQMQAAFRAEAMLPENEAYLVSAIDFGLNKAFAALERQIEAENAPKPVLVASTPKMSPRAVSQARTDAMVAFGEAQLAALIEKAAKQKAKAILMDTIMPNGKKLSQCTGQELVEIPNWLESVFSMLSE